MIFLTIGNCDPEHRRLARDHIVNMFMELKRSGRQLEASWRYRPEAFAPMATTEADDEEVGGVKMLLFPSFILLPPICCSKNNYVAIPRWQLL